jgi:hypothetical protein
MISASVLSLLSDMEADATDVEVYGSLLCHLAASPSSIEAGDLRVIAIPLHNLGIRLRKQWQQALEAAGGEA